MTEGCKQRTLDAGEQTGQIGQFLFNVLRRNARTEQLGQPLGRGHFGNIEVRQPPHFLRGHDQLAAMPAANRRNRHVQQLRQHGRRVEPLDCACCSSESG